MKTAPYPSLFTLLLYLYNDQNNLNAIHKNSHCWGQKTGSTYATSALKIFFILETKL